MLLLGAVGVNFAWEPWHGPIILSLSSGHGIDAGDLLVFPLVALAIAVWRHQALSRVPDDGRSPGSRRWLLPTSAIVLGALLLFAGVVAKAGGGPLVPSGGGTLNDTIQLTNGATAVGVGRWTNVAVTYDGSTLRLYVDGNQVASRRAKGSIQRPDSPLWIGGNEPYGEHFRGLIDEVRVYDRALGRAAIRADMDTPVRPAPGLVAGYGFDGGSGRTAADASGDGNVGTIRRATWTRGRYGSALSFDGSDSIVRVPASASLDAARALTLSGWIRPTTHQRGWRTIVQRQADAYFLNASSDRANRGGWLDDARAALLVGAAVFFCWVMASGRGSADLGRRRSWWLPVALFVLGSIADAALAPFGTLIGPALVALWLSATTSSRAERALFLGVAVVFSGLTAASLAHAAPIDVTLARDDGAIARTAALGALFVLAGAYGLTRRWRERASALTQPGRS